MKNDENLRTELSGHASGVGSIVEFAAGKGYAISADDVAT
ncbi:MAG: hypothetical protein HOK98_16815 [Rhodospirillaceae bacterium]|nr:hypothetical protein [Rhodospirillaceae bacterium]MBT6537837.1 hypothetical protein [Rhodospirillaceae bacterium]